MNLVIGFGLSGIGRGLLLVKQPGADTHGRHQQHHRGQQSGRRGAPPHPPGQPLHPARRTGRDRVAAPVAMQVLRQRRRTGVATRRLLVQTLQADGLQVARHSGVQPRGRHRVLGQHLLERRCRRLRPEWRPARQKLVQDRPQGVYVRRRPDRVPLALGLLGSHVARRADGDAAERQPAAGFQPSRQAEIRDLGRAVGGEQDVGRLEVAVDDPALVGGLDGLGYRGHQGGGLAGRLRRARHHLGQAAALDEFHGEVRPAVQVADLVDLHDVRMAQAGHGFRLAQKALQLLRPGGGAGQEHFQGDGAVEAQVPRLVDDAHAAAAQHPLHLMAADARQFAGLLRKWRGTVGGGGRGKQRADLRLHGAQALPAGADLC